MPRGIDSKVEYYEPSGSDQKQDSHPKTDETISDTKEAIAETLSSSDDKKDDK